MAAGTEAGVACVASKNEVVRATPTQHLLRARCAWAGLGGLLGSAKRLANGCSASFEEERPTPALTEQATRPASTPSLCLLALGSRCPSYRVVWSAKEYTQNTPHSRSLSCGKRVLMGAIVLMFIFKGQLKRVFRHGYE